MNIRALIFVLGNLLGILGLALLAPLGVALLYAVDDAGTWGEVRAFAVTSAGSILLGFGVRHLLRGPSDGVRLREGFAIVSLSWVLVSCVGMLPYLLVGATHSVTDAFFETMSGFTTTGATVFPELTRIPPALMFWRCMTQWLGGMGIVVLGVALLPMLGVGGYRLLKAEAPGGLAYERERPRITDAAKELWKLYLVLSAVLMVLLMASGMNLYDAVVHAFTTMATGGFSNRMESVAYYPSPFTQWVIILFMFVSGMNFALHARLARRQWRPVLRNSELRAYVIMVLICSVVAVAILGEGELSEPLLREAMFHVLSISTTTGYTTVDFNLWPNALRLMLLLLMFSGGCMGSTAGGMKVARFLIYGKVIWRELHRLIFPHAVKPVRVGNKVIEAPMVLNIFAFGAVFMVLFAVGSAAMALSGYGIVTSMSASVAALGNIGPGLGAVGPAGNWAHLPSVTKWIMSILMLFGRLEIFSVLILFTPWVWRR